MNAQVPKFLLTIPEAMEALSLSRSELYRQMDAGRIRAVKQGRKRLIPVSACHDYAALLEREAEAA